MGTVTLMGVGDVILEPDGHSVAFQHVKHILQQADIAIANCDQCYSDLGESPNGFWPIHVSATSHDAEMLDSVADAGFNLLNFGNNHSLDWGYEALFDCLERCERKGLHTLGVGANLTEARQPKIIEVNGTRIGFLAYCSVGQLGYDATQHRPGHVPMRAHTHYEQWDPQPGTPPRIHTFAFRDDLAAMTQDIEVLRGNVDVLVCNYHWGVHYIPEVIADYQYEVGHAAIDAGADLIFGHHAHLPKGVEVYKGKAIFHSMHNFACRGEWVPPSMQKGSNFPQSHHWDFTEFGARFEKQFGKLPDDIKKPTMIAKISISDKQITRVAYVPCYINDESDPEPVGQDDPRGQIVFDCFESISHNQGLQTQFRWDGDEIVIET